jgi:enoyl-CoA hydratase/carnithine racemase
MRLDCDRTSENVWRVCIEPGDADQAVIDRDGVIVLAGLLNDAEASTACRVIVFEGQEGSFCQGMDLSYLVAHPDEDVSGEAHEFARCLDCLRRLRQVVIAAVDGSVNGGGVGLAAAADVVVATARSTFGLPEVVLGLVPAIVLPVLLERMPPHQARRLALSGSVEASRAAAMGLVDHVVAEPEKLERKVRAVIKHALRCSPDSVADVKHLIERLSGLPRTEALKQGAEHTAERIADPDRLAAVEGFLRGEPLPWFDRYRPPKGGR